jgi:hypothetical protein
VKKISPQSCTATGCSETYNDNECKTGNDYESCIHDSITCSQGTSCDQDQGSNADCI